MPTSDKSGLVFCCSMVICVVNGVHLSVCCRTFDHHFYHTAPIAAPLMQSLQTPMRNLDRAPYQRVVPTTCPATVVHLASRSGLSEPHRYRRVFYRRLALCAVVQPSDFPSDDRDANASASPVAGVDVLCVVAS